MRRYGGFWHPAFSPWNEISTAFICRDSIRFGGRQTDDPAINLQTLLQSRGDDDAWKLIHNHQFFSERDTYVHVRYMLSEFRPISAHSASTVIASEKSSISTYRKSITRFPTSHRWTVYVTPKCPKGWHKNAISLFVPVKFNFCRKTSATKFLCVKTSSGKL